MSAMIEGSSAASASALTGPSGFLPGLAYEWRRISWPTPLQLMMQTAVVIGMTGLMTLVIWGLDWFWRVVIAWMVPGSGL